MDDLSKKFELIESELAQLEEQEGGEASGALLSNVGPSYKTQRVEETLVWGLGKKQKDANWVKSSVSKIFSTVYPNKRNKVYIKNLSPKSCYGYIDHKKDYIDVLQKISLYPSGAIQYYFR